MRTPRTLAVAALSAVTLLGPALAQVEESTVEPERKAAVLFSNGSKRHLLSPYDLGRWTASVNLQNIQREVLMGLAEENVKIRRYTGEIGIDLFPWLTVYGAAGLNEFSAELATGDDRGDTEETWGAGIKARLVEYYLLGGADLEDKFVLDVHARYIDITSEVGARDLEWEQTEVMLRLGIVNEIDGDRGYSPEEITVWLGPVSSTIEGEISGGRTDEIEEADDIGFAAGIDVRFTKNASLVWDAQLYDEKLTQNLGLTFHF